MVLQDWIYRKTTTLFTLSTHKKKTKKGKAWVSWCFEPSQPQRITSGLITNFSLSPCYSFHKSLYHTSVFFPSKTTAQILSTISKHKTSKRSKDCSFIVVSCIKDSRQSQGIRSTVISWSNWLFISRSLCCLKKQTFTPRGLSKNSVLFHRDAVAKIVDGKGNVSGKMERGRTI